MTAPNRATLWGRVVVDELAKSGVTDVCLAPGSRCTPLTVAAAEHDEITTFSHLDERSAAFFALGRARRGGDPVALVCTSGTAAANFHPAVIEAHHSRVPLVVCTADRPAELQNSGANQTIDQDGLYGDATRYARTLPEPAPEPRRLRSLRTTVCRAASAAGGGGGGSYPGPVHLNVPLAKPLEPTPVEGDVPADLADRAPAAVGGRDGPWVKIDAGKGTLDGAVLDRLTSAIETCDNGLIVSGPANAPAPDRETLARLVDATGFPVLADPLSGHRFGDHVADRPIAGGYDAYAEELREGPTPDVVLRFGASPTSKALRQYLRDADARSFLIDPAGQWREAEFAATDLVVADEDRVATAIAESVSRKPGPLAERIATAEASHWDAVERSTAGDIFEGATDDDPVEGAIAAAVVDALPDPATLYVSNSMPVRDVDRFARPRPTDLTVLGNRGASGIDGITSSALGAASATDDPLVCLLGDLAFYHDANGLLAVDRLDVDATIVVVNNDGGGIFHKLPIENFDPPFTDLFRTPHGLDFAATADQYGLEYDRVSTTSELGDAVVDSTGRGGTQLIEISVDAAESHRWRESTREGS